MAAAHWNDHLFSRISKDADATLQDRLSKELQRPCCLSFLHIEGVSPLIFSFLAVIGHTFLSRWL